MPDPVSQSYGNHTRWDPLFHFFALPVIGLTVIVTIIHFAQRRTFFSGWLVIFSLAMIVVTVKARLFALKAQDRVIRLEERMRLSTLVAEPLRSRINELSEGQLVALRFACDSELPGLAQDALARKLSQSEIKKSIKVWRADYFRV